MVLNHIAFKKRVYLSSLFALNEELNQSILSET